MELQLSIFLLIYIILIVLNRHKFSSLKRLKRYLNTQEEEENNLCVKFPGTFRPLPFQTLSTLSHPGTFRPLPFQALSTLSLPGTFHPFPSRHFPPFPFQALSALSLPGTLRPNPSGHFPPFSIHALFNLTDTS